MRKLTAALAAFALCAALMTGCADMNGASSNSNGAATSNPATSGGMADSGNLNTATPDPGASSTPMEDNTNTNNTMGAGNYSAEALDAILNEIIDYGAETAGVTLKQAIAAADLVNFAANDATTSATLGADIQAWLDGLTEDQKETLRENWPGVCQEAENILNDLDDQTGILADAGVTYDFTTMDLSGVQAFLNTVGSILGAY